MYSHSLGFVAVFDQRKERDAFCPEDSLEPFNRLVDGVIAGLTRDSGIWIRFRWTLLKFAGVPWPFIVSEKDLALQT